MVKSAFASRVSWALVANVVYTLCQLGTLVVIVKAGTVSMLGSFTLAIAVTTPVFLVTGLQIRAVVATDVAGRFLLSEYAGLQIAAGVVGLAATEAIAHAAGFPPATVSVVRALALAKAVECVSESYLGRLQLEDRLDLVALSVSLKGVLAVAGLGTLLMTTARIEVASLAIAGAWLLTLFAVEIPAARKLRPEPMAPRFEWSSLRSMAGLFLPLGVVTGITALTVNVPRYALERMMGETTVGVFSAVAYIAAGMGIIGRVFNQSTLSTMAECLERGDVASLRRMKNRLTAASLLLGATGVAAALLAGPEMLRLLYNAEFGSQHILLAVLTAGNAIALTASTLLQTITAAGQYRVQVPLTLLSVAVALAGSLILIPLYGMIGAAVAFLAAQLTLVTGCAVSLSGMLVPAPIEPLTYTKQES